MCLGVNSCWIESISDVVESSDKVIRTWRSIDDKLKTLTSYKNETPTVISKTSELSSENIGTWFSKN